MSEYSELLKDPRWQKRRLETLERDNWKCLICNDKESTLHVHHKWYVKGLKPWEYRETCLITLCDSCHKFEHSIKEKSIKALAISFLSKGLANSDLISIAEVVSVEGMVVGVTVGSGEVEVKMQPRHK